MPLRVVLVDDDDRFRAMAHRALVADGFDVVAEVGEGAAAPDVVAACKPDLVLVDIRMPRIDGLEVARRLGAAAAPPPVILISTIDVVDGRRLADGIAVGYLPKDELSLGAITEVLRSA